MATKLLGMIVILCATGIFTGCQAPYSASGYQGGCCGGACGVPATSYPTTTYRASNPTPSAMNSSFGI